MTFKLRLVPPLADKFCLLQEVDRQSHSGLILLCVCFMKLVEHQECPDVKNYK